MEAACFNVSLAKAITEDGQELPITNWLDGDGDECEPDDAVACVAGPDKDGLWLSIDMTAFDTVPLQ